MTRNELFELIQGVMHENMVTGHLDDGRSFHFTKPAPDRYPYQFFWDTCFHVFIFSALGDNEMAKHHLRSLFAMQKPDGFVGHILYWDRLRPGRPTDFFQVEPRFRNLYRSHMSALIQPPLVAQAVQRVYRACGDKEFLKGILPKLKKYYQWLAANRDFDGDALISIISPFESGMDWKPTYDVALGRRRKQADWRLFLKVTGVDFRNFLHNFNLNTIYNKGYFLVKDVGMNTIYAQNLYAMASLCNALDDPESKTFSELGDRVTQSMLELMYDEEDAAFYDLHGKENQKIKVLTPTVFYPVVIKSMPTELAQRVLQTHFFNEDEFGASFPLPSVAKNDPSFNPNESMYIWRGPTWIANNWFMHKYLMVRGYRQESKKMIESIRLLIRKSGLREYYNPITGEGYGAKSFTWAGLVLDMIRMEEE